MTHHTPDTTSIQKHCFKKWGCNIVFSRYSPVDKSIVLTEITSKDPSKGKGSLCLQHIIKMLPGLGIEKIWLLAKPINGGDAFRLACWYMRHRFKIIKLNLGDFGEVESVEMERVL